MKRKEALADNSQAERAQSNVGENAQQVQDMAMDGSKAIIGAAIEDRGLDMGGNKSRGRRAGNGRAGEGGRGQEQRRRGERSGGQGER